MKKPKTILITALVAILGFFGYQVFPNLGGAGGEVSFNKIDNLTTISTTTTSASPVKLLDLNVDRRYVVVSNVSDTAVYLFATTTDLTVDGQGGVSATSSIQYLDGIYIAANSNYVFDTDNMVYSNLWASSTAASKQINISYK